MTLTLIRVITLFVCIAILAPGRNQAEDPLKYQRGNLKPWRGGDVTQVVEPLVPLVYDVGTFGKFIRWYHTPQSHELLRADGTPYTHYKLKLTGRGNKLALESLASVDLAERNDLLELAKIQLPQGTTVTLVFDSNTFEVKYPRRLSFWKKHVNIRLLDTDWGFRLYLKPIQVIFSFEFFQRRSWVARTSIFRLPPLACEHQEYQMICHEKFYPLDETGSFLPFLSIVATKKKQQGPLAAYLVPTKDGKLRAVEDLPSGDSLIAYHDRFYHGKKVHCRDEENPLTGRKYRIRTIGERT